MITEVEVREPRRAPAYPEGADAARPHGPNESPSQTELLLSDYLALLWRRRRTVGLTMLLVLAAATIATFLQPRNYEASSAVLIRTETTANLFPLDNVLSVTRSLAGEQTFLSSHEFQDLAAEQSPVGAEVTVSHGNNVDGGDADSILVFTASASSSTAAADAANTWAKTYVSQRHRFEIDELVASSAALRTSIQRLEQDRNVATEPLTNVDEALAAGTSPLEIAQLNAERLLILELIESEVGALDTQIARLNEDLADIEVTLELLVSPEQSARVSEPAAAPATPASPNITRNVLLGLVSSIIFGVGAALLRESLDTSARTASTIRNSTGLIQLASIPLRSRRSGLAAARQAHQRVLSKLNLADSMGESTQVLMITSCLAGEGKTTTATTLARLSARGGYATLLIEADLHRPEASQELEVANRIGLADYLSDELTLDEITFTSPLSSELDVIPAGLVDSERALDLLRRPAFSALVEKARGRYDRVIIDTPPLLAVIDSLEVAVHCDSAILIVRSGAVTPDELNESCELLHSSRVPVLGTVTIGISPDFGINGRRGYRSRALGYQNQSRSRSRSN